MSVNPNKLFKELQSHLDKYGITIVKWDQGNRHHKVWITDGNIQRFIFVSVSPSDGRAYHNMAKTARATLREAP